MSEHRRVRRCAVVMIEPRERLVLDVGSLLAGESALASEMSCVALAPHLGGEVELDDDELVALMRIGETPWLPIEKIEHTIPANTATRLMEKGLLIGDGESHAALRERDDAVREGYWRPLSAVAHYFSRWSDTGVDEDARITRHRSITDLVSEYGLPPPHLTERVAHDAQMRLPPPDDSALDDLFRRRATCRNFDTGAALTQEQLSSLLQRVLGCLAIVEVVPGAHGLKKSHPSGGGLHPLEPYLLIRRVEGIETGLYHYHAGEHALEPLTQLPADEAQQLAKKFVAGQDFFADAPVHVILVARFRRTFWKYRNHPKAYRAIVLEAGHVSQNLYLAATEAQMGAYVTAAINEVDIERAFGLDPLRESPIAVCGFGARAAVKTMMEFDPLGAVWDGDARIAADQ
jgi:putative peptide maturation dehydrogenase